MKADYSGVGGFPDRVCSPRRGRPAARSDPSAARSDISNQSSYNPAAAASDLRNPSAINPAAAAFSASSTEHRRLESPRRCGTAAGAPVDRATAPSNRAHDRRTLRCEAG